MAIIEQTWTFFPGRSYSQAELSEALPRWLDGRALGLARQLFRRSAVERRNMVITPEELVSVGRSFAAKNELYCTTVRDACGALARRIAEGTTEDERDSIDLVITASCTGFQIPAMDATLVAALSLSPNVRRINLTQHGCAGGAAALAIAHEWLVGHPEARALVVCVELCSLTFLPEDRSEENLVSAAIFADGAAAVILAGERAERRDMKVPALRVRDTFRELFACTEHFMGFEVRDEGLKIKLSRDVVAFAERGLPDLFARVLRRFDVPDASRLSFGAVHPGGRRVLEALEDHARFPKSVTRTSWDTLEQHGNMSSVTVLVALDQLLHEEGPLGPGALGLVTAFGPGFCAEIGLLETTSGQ
ncbi:3-oxoacyl-[acyl-carrier-protein] synthase III C-terminal domain-containing protein [Polyangium mundeleinium]|uniref:3-oxoacyl-[acyl-carrier-protein] synthase III C-terminal domain-containing protein n=1 Tax=Polyangium mundeleinium TaxID=2995306 RepID=A0ABT5ERY9_9BACT|nr:3-oxoacyl-[acyl-carrier-protein] synthase III C-terminal domain-containing protein [Polyangium mundeleinium]MDC0744249.1 3-oxoacyl-[acyl-carrier-protein] synthase III C-terminal domain-containing protein [Polyangium mundeleinium]